MFKIMDEEIARNISDKLAITGTKCSIPSKLSIMEGYAASRARSLANRTIPTKGGEVVIHEGDFSCVMLVGGPANSYLVPIAYSQGDDMVTCIERNSHSAAMNSDIQGMIAKKLEMMFEDNGPIMRVGTTTRKDK
jgi:hypothetical protein